MKIVADIHLHSYYSRATSKSLNLEHLHKWAQLKGVNVVGTGDIAHPGWLQEMQEKLEPAEDGLFRLKPEYSKVTQPEVPKACAGMVRFMLAGEISNIYKRHDKVRKIHNVVFMPSFDALEKFQSTLDKIGNIRSDGRPILGLDSRDLLEIVLETDPQGYLIPAHIWTPWFAMLGSMSGFDSVEECFGDLTDQIFALETGLSSDPPMNERLSILDRYTLVSNSDAHSPQKLAREANLFDTDLSYDAIFSALKSGDRDKFLGTIEFFPEEGKYHYDGHRKCRVCWDPRTTIAHDGICSDCGKRVTVGVMHRVEALADREPGQIPSLPHPYQSLVPLPEVLSEIHGVGVNSKRVRQSFDYLLSKLGSELHILQEAAIADISRFAGDMVAEGIKRIRAGEIKIAAGYDGEFGKIQLFEKAEREEFTTQLSFFMDNVKRAAQEDMEKQASAAVSDETDTPAPVRPVPKAKTVMPDSPRLTAQGDGGEMHNHEQEQAVKHTAGPLLIVAGPGTGKTRTLTNRIVGLIAAGHARPDEILAVTFTNKAAEEMQARLTRSLQPQQIAALTICTFHSLGIRILAEFGHLIDVPPIFSICDEADKLGLLRTLVKDIPKVELQELSAAISAAKRSLLSPETARKSNTFATPAHFSGYFQGYEDELRARQALDFEDLISRTVCLLQEHAGVRTACRQRFKWISVDEYQDVNFAQYRFLKLLCGDHTNLCAIGDPDQAIYGFRGATPQYFLDFARDFPGTRMIRLGRNYRSAHNIVAASAQVLNRTARDDEYSNWSQIVTEKKISIYSAPTGKAEAEYVVHQIEKMVGGTSYFSIDSERVSGQTLPSATFRDFAVLYRLNSQSTLLEEAFDRSGIPYQVIGRQSSYQNQPFKGLLQQLWLLVGEVNDTLLAQRLAETRLGIGPMALQKLLNFAHHEATGIWEAMQTVAKIPGLNTRQRAAIATFSTRLKALRTNTVPLSVSEIIVRTIAGFYPDDYFAADKPARTLSRFILAAKPFGADLAGFLRACAITSETDDYDPRADRVSLMTLHAAKGMEFGVVFIVGCEQGILPFESEKATSDEDEERRLLYVGMTRAREQLVLTHANKRLRFGKTLTPPRSKFLNNIERSLTKAEQAKAIKKKKDPDKTQISLF